MSRGGALRAREARASPPRSDDALDLRASVNLKTRPAAQQRGQGGFGTRNGITA
jgi:hypothetical protein